MNSGTISQLPKETTSLIASTQIITTVSTAVKELVENSLDAAAKNILVKLKNYGLDSIEVKDDGYGISCENVHKMFLPGYTSKISGFEDLDKLCSYGFRGEALAALCRVANVTITTKSNSDTLAMTYTIDPNGIPVSSKPSHITKGTIITVNNLFGNLPVRKQYLSSKKKLGEELKKVEQIIHQLAVIKPDLRMSLVHNGCNIFQKNSVKELKQSFMQVIGLKLASQMEYLCETLEKIIIDLIIPKKNLENVENLLSTNNTMFLYVNGRPIVYKNITKILMEHIFLNFNLESSSKTCMALISLNIPPNEIDINLEPNKTKLLLKNEKQIVKILDDLLSTFYQQKIQREEEQQQEDKNEENSSDEEIEINTQPKRPRLDPVENLMMLQSRDEEFREKNNGWGIEIIGDIEPITEKPKTSVKTICSQINSDNCILTTEKEVSELNSVLKDSSSGSVNKFNSEIKYIVDPKLTSLEKKILPDWPVRNLPEKSPVKVRSALFGTEEWSKGEVETEKGVLEGGARLLLPQVKDIDSEKSSEINGILNEPEKSAPEVRDLAFEGETSSNVDKSVQKLFQPTVKEILSKNEAGSKILDGPLYTEVKENSLVNTPKPEKKQTVLPSIFQIKKSEKSNLPADIPETSNKKEIKKKVKKKPIRKEISAKISVEKILTLRNLKLDDSDGIKLLGQLKPSGNWLYIKNSEIGHVRHSGLQELIISQKMLANHSVPLKDCDKAILINENILGKEFWDVLISLDMEFDALTSRYIVKEDVIRMNGFKIEMEKEEETGKVVRGLITQVASTIPHYGIGELRDVLALYMKHGECGGLAKWRTTPLWNYISNESIRISQQSPRLIERDEIQNLIDTWQSYLNHLEPKCLHSKDIFVPIYQLENSLSQTIISSQY